MFPLPVFPTIPGDLESMDPRMSVQHMNTFMKNTLIRGLNNVYQTSPLATNKKFTTPFVRYVVMVIETLRLHLEGDQLFFTKRNAQGRSIVDFLGITNSYLKDCTALLAFLQGMQQMLQKWTKAPQTYSHDDLRGSLGTLSALMLRHMESQRNALSKEYLMKYFSEKEMRDMITENLTWLAAHSDMAVLLPYVLSHHDAATSARWPNIASEGLKMVPEFVNKDIQSWAFAPFDPVTKKRSAALG